MRWRLTQAGQVKFARELGILNPISNTNRTELGMICCCSVAKSCLTLCDPMDCSTPGFPVLHYLLELAQTHVHRVGDAIQTSHPLSSPSLPAFSLSQHQGLSQWLGIKAWGLIKAWGQHCIRNLIVLRERSALRLNSVSSLNPATQWSSPWLHVRITKGLTEWIWFTRPGEWPGHLH